MKHFFRFLIPVIFCLLSLGSKAATITAQQSGSWWSASTWAGGIVPGTSDVIVIPAGITVSVYGPTFDTQWTLDRWSNPAAIQVYGTLSVIDNPADGGTNGYGIYFLNPLALTVYSGGDVADNTSGGLWFLTENSALAIQTGGNFTENPNAVYTIRTEFVNGTYFPPGASTGRPQYEYDFTAVAGNQYAGPLTVAMAGGNFTATSTFTAPSGPSAPSVTTGSASSITPNTATIGGTVNDDGASTTVSFIYGTDATLTSGTSTATGAPSPIGTGSGSTAVSANLTGLSPSTKYYYEVKATNSAGNATGTILNFTTAAPLCSIVATVTSQTNVSCNGGSNGSATVSASGGTGPYTYSWSPSGGTGATASGLSVGTYTVTVTDANSCSTTKSVTINQPTVITASVSSQTNVSCNGGSNGSATVSASGGTGPYTYSWSPSGGTGATASGLSANMYTVTITDANGCTKTTTATITQPTVITASVSSQTNVSCNGGSNGSATVSASGGTGPYTYSWSPSGGTGATASGLSANMYTVTITDANGCTKTTTATITQPTVITASVSSQTNVSCNGGSNGSATVSASGGTGPYTYSWSPSGGTGATASGLSANMYTVTITDANGCTKTTTATITQPTVITASVSSQTNVSCNGGSNGSATVSASGGTGPYTYSWSPSGGTGATASGLSANMYTVTITDANGCTKTTTATITQPTVITTTGAQTNVSSYGGSDGSATVSASGGTGPYTYSWSPSGGTGVTATGLAEGTYTVTITDANGCTATSSFTITQPTGTTVTSINRVSSTPANSSTVSYEVTFAANVTGISASNFSLTTSGLSGTSIDPTLTGSGNVYTVTVHTGSGNGTLALNLLNSSGILPAVSNAPFTAGDVYTIDKIAPSVSIGAPSASITKAGPVSYTITYADDNFNTSTLSSSDITVNSSGTAAAGSVSVSGSGLTRTVQLSGITGNGTLGISLAAATATDNAGNVALAAGPSATFVADNTAPITTIGNPSAASVNTGSGPISYTVAYADDNFDNSTLTTGNITLNSTGTAMGTVGITGSGTSYTVTISNISGIGTLGISVAAGTATDNAGNIASAAGPSATFAVTPIDQHLTFNALSSKTYGDADFSPSATSDNNTIPVTYTSDNPAVATIIGSNIHIVSQGTVNIKASQAADANHNAATDVQQSLTVNPKSLTVTLNSTPAITKIYDGTASATLGSGNYTLNGVVGSDAVTVSGTASYDDANAGSGKTVTANAFIMDGAQKDNYTLSTTSAATTGSISAGPITVTANAKTKVYGTPDPVLDYAVTGLVNGDDASIFSGSLTRDPGENTGTYPITQGTLSAGGNYTLNFTGSLLAIASAPQQITWTQQLSVGCDGTTQLQLTGISTSGLPLTYTSSDATVATVTGDVLTLVRPGSVTITAAQPGDGNHLAATPVNNTVIYQSSSLLRQHWDDAIFFDNTGGNYVQWQWYKNGNAVSGATSPYYSETPVLSGQYYVIATDKDGRQIQTCPLNAAGNGTVTGGIKVFPNPASSGVSVTVTCNYSTSALQGAQLQVLNISGVIMQTLTSVQPTMQVTMPAARGIYIINLVLSNGQKASVNVLVK